MTQRVLVTGAFGQVGKQLFSQLQNIYGVQKVVALGHIRVPQQVIGTVQRCDVADIPTLRQIFKKYQFTQVYHLAAVLSGAGEKDPDRAWEVNLIGFKGLLDLCVEFKVHRVFWASTISVFGPTTPKQNTPQHTSIQPVTMYSITKHAAELLSQYYFIKYGLDVRSLRYPAIVNWNQQPENYATEYIICLFIAALTTGKYECFVREDTTLPIIYMKDAIAATIAIMQADPSQIKVRTSYNLVGFSFKVSELVNEIRKHLPLEVEYKVDHRQITVDSWPDSIDDCQARKDWGWRPNFTLQNFVSEIIDKLGRVIRASQ